MRAEERHFGSVLRRAQAHRPIRTKGGCRSLTTQTRPVDDLPISQRFADINLERNPIVAWAVVVAAGQSFDRESHHDALRLDSHVRLLYLAGLATRTAEPGYGSSEGGRLRCRRRGVLDLPDRRVSCSVIGPACSKVGRQRGREAIAHISDVSGMLVGSCASAPLEILPGRRRPCRSRVDDRSGCPRRRVGRGRRARS